MQQLVTTHDTHDTPTRFRHPADIEINRLRVTAWEVTQCHTHVMLDETKLALPYYREDRSALRDVRERVDVRINGIGIRERSGCCYVSCVPIKNKERGEQHVV